MQNNMIISTCELVNKITSSQVIEITDKSIDK